MPRRITEQNNPHSAGFSEMDTLQMVTTINREDQAVAMAVEKALPAVAEAAEAAANRLADGGRMYYFGAGTSGRLGILDASELPCTYGVDPSLVQAIIAGGPSAVYDAAMGDEDSVENGEADIARLCVSAADIVVGIAASGRTPYVLGAVEAAKRVGALTVGITNTAGSPLSTAAAIAVVAETGPEVIEGSTRMKAGTAQKMILNMLSTAAMARIGYVYQNYMVRMVPNNTKLFERAVHIVNCCTGESDEICRATLEQSNWEIDTAIVMLLCDTDAAGATKLLTENGRCIGRVLRSRVEK